MRDEDMRVKDMCDEDMCDEDMCDGSVSELCSPRILEAINVAATAHDGHYRKGSAIPYVSHVFAVMYLASQQGLEEPLAEDVKIACLLHDLLEDVPEKYPAEQIEEVFGHRVLTLVESVTKDDTLPDWQSRADAYLKKLDSADYGAVVVAACDKLHNLSSILADYEVVGEEIWKRFNSGKQSQQWWYCQVFDVVSRRAPTLPLVPEYEKKLRVLLSL